MNKSKKLLKEMRKRMQLEDRSVTIHATVSDLKEWAGQVDTLLERPQDKKKRK